jgi:hypothetical protein
MTGDLVLLRGGSSYSVGQLSSPSTGQESGLYFKCGSRWEFGEEKISISDESTLNVWGV